MFKNVHYFWLCFFFTISNVYKYCLDLLLFSVFLDSFSLWCLQFGIKIGIFIFLALYSCIYSLSGFSAKDQCVNVQHIWRDLNMWLPEMLMCDLKQAFHSWKPCSVVDLKKKQKKKTLQRRVGQSSFTVIWKTLPVITHLISVRAAKSGKTSY